ncbi:MAG TPA: hypothetical protein VK119_08670 [Bacillota bacterium]|nr:hypothetical protein [Bacillota bacterium]
MEKQETLEKEYRTKRRVYEEQEEDLFIQRDKAISIIDEVQDRSHYYLKDIVPEHDILMRGFRQTEKLREDLIDSTKEELKRLSRKIERLDENYYRKLRKLNESEK